MSKQYLESRSTLDTKLSLPSHRVAIPAQVSSTLSERLFPQVHNQLILDYLFSIKEIKLSREIYIFILEISNDLCRFDKLIKCGFGYAYHYMKMILKILELSGYSEEYKRDIETEKTYLPMENYPDLMVALRFLILLKPPSDLVTKDYLDFDGYLFTRIIRKCAPHKFERGNQIFIEICQYAHFKYNVITPLVYAAQTFNWKKTYDGSHHIQKFEKTKSHECKIEILKYSFQRPQYNNFTLVRGTSNYGSIFSIQFQKNWDDGMIASLPKAVKERISKIYGEFEKYKLGLIERVYTDAVTLQSQKTKFKQLADYVERVDKFDPEAIEAHINATWAAELNRERARQLFREVLDILTEAAVILKDCKHNRQIYDVLKDEKEPGSLSNR